MQKLVIAVGSTNPVKVNSVRTAFKMNFPETELEICGYSVPSGVPDQPWGDAETRQGALNRAENCLGVHAMQHGGGMPDYAVGLEGGVAMQELRTQHPDSPGLNDGVCNCFAYMAILRVADTRWGISRTGEFAQAH